MEKILLIDDEEGIRDVWPRFHDYAEPVFRGRLGMDTASDLEHGVKRMKEATYDALILDLKFLGKGSDDTISWIFEHHKHLPPIIVLTGDEDIFVRGRCMMAGASDFWTKKDAQAHPDLFFKAIYNQYLKRFYVGPTTS